MHLDVMNLILMYISHIKKCNHNVNKNSKQITGQIFLEVDYMCFVSVSGFLIFFLINKRGGINFYIFTFGVDIKK